MNTRILDPPYDNKEVILKNTPIGLTMTLREQIILKATRLNVTMRSLLLASVLAGFDNIKTQEDVVKIINAHLKNENN